MKLEISRIFLIISLESRTFSINYNSFQDVDEVFSPSVQNREAVIFETFCLVVTQNRMNGAPSESQNHL